MFELSRALYVLSVGKKCVWGMVLETPLMLGYRDTLTSIIRLVHKVNKFI
jgi:hypothetical protein